jgi:hypothetical protein
MRDPLHIPIGWPRQAIEGIDLGFSAETPLSLRYRDHAPPCARDFVAGQQRSYIAAADLPSSFDDEPAQRECPRSYRRPFAPCHSRRELQGSGLDTMQLSERPGNG